MVGIFGIAVARLFRGGDFLPIREKPPASEEAGYSVAKNRLLEFSILGE
jgi:hypothetical protein